MRFIVELSHLIRVIAGFCGVIGRIAVLAPGFWRGFGGCFGLARPPRGATVGACLGNRAG